MGKISSARKWSAKENEIIFKYLRSEREEIVRRLPGRTWGAIQTQGYRIGAIVAWEPRETRKLHARYADCKIQDLSEIVSDSGKHDLHDCLRKAYREGLDRKRYRYQKATNKRWTPVDIAFLHDNYNNYTTEQLVELFGGKFSKADIFARANYDGLKKQRSWTADETRFLVDNWGKADPDFVFNALAERHDQKSVQRKLSHLGISASLEKARLVARLSAAKCS